MSEQAWGDRLAHSLLSARQSARQRGHRLTLVFSGQGQWCYDTTEWMLETQRFSESIWIGDANRHNGINAPQAQQLLGRELDCVVFDAHSGFDPDAFGAVCGTLRAGGVLLLLTPSFESWPTFPDPTYQRFVSPLDRHKPVAGRFLRRLQRVITNDPYVTVLKQGIDVPLFERTTSDGTASEFKLGGSNDQLLAVDAIIKVAKGHRRRPAVLLSDRGRGKSAAFGLAAARLLQQGLRTILVTAPRVGATESLFEQLSRTLPHADVKRGVITLGDATVRFVPPDVLVRNQPNADLVLVDEAAAIATPMLETLLKRYARIAFATTVHGYEGSGQGFSIRFFKTLDRLTPDWSELRLVTPIRWANDDPLERFVARVLLLDADVSPNIAASSRAEAVIEKLDRDQLCCDDELLSQVFGLLVTAHYRTRPIDLMQLLDDPNLDVWITRAGGRVIATALVLAEGPLSVQLTDDIFNGYRRVPGHLIPQSFVAHIGIKPFSSLVGWRVMRIAVDPSLQSAGVGSTLLNQICAHAQRAGLDWLGSSFGATPELLRFWRDNELWPVRLGTRRDAASGCYSVLVLKPLSAAAVSCHKAARAQFLAHFPLLLPDVFAELEPCLVVELMRNTDHSVHSQFSPGDFEAIEAFARNRRDYDACAVQIWALTVFGIGRINVYELLEESQLALLITKVLQKRSWQDSVQILNLNGRSDGIAQLRGVVKILLDTVKMAR